MQNSPSSTGNGPGTQNQVYFGLPDIYVDVGAHIAHFFRGEQERLSVLLPFIQAGLEAGDQCLLIVEPSVSPNITNWLTDLGVDVERALEQGQLVVSEGSRGVGEMGSMFSALISKAMRAGRGQMRIAGDMTWALAKMPTSEMLLQWEAFFDSYVGTQVDFVALCQYDYARFGGGAVMAALQTHPLAIIGNIVQENPFYRDPVETLNEAYNQVYRGRGSSES